LEQRLSAFKRRFAAELVQADEEVKQL
jgi:hypothetical protein